MKKIKRLKIVEQIAIVTFFSVITPLVIAGLIVNNINQHGIRRELSYSAEMIAESIENNIHSLVESDEGKLKEVVLATKYFPNDYIEDVYLKDVVINSNLFKDLQIIMPSQLKADFKEPSRLHYNEENQDLILAEKIHDDKYLVATVDVEKFKDKIFENIKNDKRQIYVLDSNTGGLIFAHNYSKDDFENVKKLLPSKLEIDVPVTYGDIKNQPLAYLKASGTNLLVIVNTTHEITEKTINTARAKIIVAILVAAAFILLLVGIYTYYLYINIKQLFKGIMAISKGNYKRQIRLLMNFFTPSEVVFLASEFNKMVNEINVSYKKLKQKNIELKHLDEFRSNLVDTVSHEFRTPLTSIKGYTSRLLRQDIVLDEAMKHKSLVVIKQQSERLARMVEDLLVIPDIEGAKLNIRLEDVNLWDTVESSFLSIRNVENRIVENLVPADFPLVRADKDRIEQVIINLVENATKYAYEDSPIVISAEVENDRAILTVFNKADYIDKEKLEKLFEKFTRVEDDTTRTTRGTGLGLFIVKGLVEAMHGAIYLKSSVKNEFWVKVILPLVKESEQA
ncbi:MAG: ATP-binding protein [Candidatus Gastranaerophilales bacterium]|nr:ATP-binding protein [Candidatus Gastranaerophilales bacterium]